MKKFSTKIIAALLSFVFMFAGVFAIAVNAEEIEPAICLEDHFSNLNRASNTYVPSNTMDSCPYVVMSMLLTFYDTYWDDDFVVTNLEWDCGSFDSSTETLLSTFSATSERDAWELWKTNNPGTDFTDFEIENQANYLQPYLISLGKFAGYHTNIEENGYGLTGLQVYLFLKNYLNARGLGEDKVTVHMQTAGLLDVFQDDLNDTIKEQLNKGFPVIYFGSKINNTEISTIEDIFNLQTGHFMVAYGETNNGDIKLHNGWNSSEYTTVNTTDYQYNNLAIWLEINEDNFPHECSNNYYDTDKNSYVCACNVYYKTHPQHNHFYYDSYSVSGHYGMCICGVTADFETHNIIYSTIEGQPSQHFERCIGCNYKRTIHHEYDYEEISNEYHYKECACGQNNTEPHYEQKYTPTGITQHHIYCKCGYSFGTESHTFTQIGTYNVCDYCGYKMLAPGGGMIMGTDDEPVTE